MKKTIKLALALTVMTNSLQATIPLTSEVPLTATAQVTLSPTMLPLPSQLLPADQGVSPAKKRVIYGALTSVLPVAIMALGYSYPIQNEKDDIGQIVRIVGLFGGALLSVIPLNLFAKAVELKTTPRSSSYFPAINSGIHTVLTSLIAILAIGGGALFSKDEDLSIRNFARFIAALGVASIALPIHFFFKTKEKLRNRRQILENNKLVAVQNSTSVQA